MQKSAKDGPNAEAPITHKETPKEFRTLGFDLRYLSPY